MTDADEKQILGPILKDLYAYYELRVKKLIKFLYEQRYTMSDVALVLGVTRQAIAHRYPKNLMLKEGMTKDEVKQAQDDHLEGDK